MALTQDVQIVEWGVPGDAHQLLNYQIEGSATIYRGSIALLRPGTGALKNSAVPSALDICVGLIDTGGPGVPNFTPGVVNTSTVASTLGVTADIRTGTFYLAGDSTMTASAIGGTVYVVNETTVSFSSSGGTLPKAGVLLFIDPAPPPTALGAFCVKFNVVGSP